MTKQNYANGILVSIWIYRSVQLYCLRYVYELNGPNLKRQIDVTIIES